MIMRKILLAACVMMITAMSACTQNKAGANSAVADSTDVEESRKESVTLCFTGDVMMGTNFPGNYITKDRGKSLFKDCDSIMRNADVAIVNLEGTCYDGTDGELRKMTNPNTYFIFRMPGDHAQRLADAGVDAVGFANNHSFDFGMTGRKNTIKTMRDAGIRVAGVKELAEGAVFEREGVKYAYIAFAASCTKVLDMLDREEVDSMIKKYRDMGDVLIVSFHGGAEGTSFMHVPKKVEYYVGENRGDVYEFAHHCVDMGVDIVVGHGPHVPRGIELYKGHIIAYSLGNFCTPYRMGTRGTTGYAPLLEVNLNTADGTFLGGKIHSYKQTEGVGPRKDADNSVAKLMRDLSAADFPQSQLFISNDGKVELVNKTEKK